MVISFQEGCGTVGGVGNVFLGATFIQLLHESTQNLNWLSKIIFQILNKEKLK